MNKEQRDRVIERLNRYRREQNCWSGWEKFYANLKKELQEALAAGSPRAGALRAELDDADQMYQQCNERDKAFARLREAVHGYFNFGVNDLEIRVVAGWNAPDREHIDLAADITRKTPAAVQVSIASTLSREEASAALLQIADSLALQAGPVFVEADALAKWVQPAPATPLPADRV